MRPEAGKALGNRYRLIRQIAVGGMGEVWVARDESLAREIAVKVLKQEFVGNDDFLNRFRTEARNSASLSHANIAQLYDYGEQDGSAYLVMELVSGEPMSDLLERDQIIALPRLLSILAQTSRALHAAHVGGVVHRDIKPGNILLEESGDVKITDFGVSLAANQIPMTAAGMVMGTAQYLSPEQAIGQAATGASDVYALGIVAYEALVGKRPFTGKTPVDIAISHVNDPVPPLPAGIDPELGALIIKMLAKEPADRPRSAAALAHTFESTAKRLAPRRAAKPVPKPTVVPTLAVPPQGAPGAKTEPRRVRPHTGEPHRGAPQRALPQAAGPARVEPQRTRQGGPQSRAAAQSGSTRRSSPQVIAGAGQSTRSQARAQAQRPPATRTTRSSATPAKGIVASIKNLGVFTIGLIFIVTLVLGATIVRALMGGNSADSVSMQVSVTQTVQFISEQYDRSGTSSIEGLGIRPDTHSLPNIKDAKW